MAKRDFFGEAIVVMRTFNQKMKMFSCNKYF